MSQTPAANRAANLVRLVATSSQTVGPFFHFGLADEATLGCLVRADTRGERIRLRVRVLDGDAQPLPDALVEVWQADADGIYVRPQDPRTCSRQRAFADSGVCQLAPTARACSRRSVPGAVRDAQGRTEAPHINVCLFARGLLRQVYTRIYFAGRSGSRVGRRAGVRSARNGARRCWRSRLVPASGPSTSGSRVTAKPCSSICDTPRLNMSSRLIDSLATTDALAGDLFGPLARAGDAGFRGRPRSGGGEGRRDSRERRRLDRRRRERRWVSTRRRLPEMRARRGRFRFRW